MKHFASLSDAIREGAKLRPQAYGGMARGVVVATCPLAAAYEAVYETLDDVSVTPLEALYPYMKERATCPVPECEGASEPDVISTIIHLNDIHRLSRETVADWVELQEERVGFVTLDVSGEQPGAQNNSRSLAQVRV